MPDLIITITIPVAKQTKVSKVTGAVDGAELKEWIIDKYKEEARRYDESQAVGTVSDDNDSLI